MMLVNSYVDDIKWSLRGAYKKDKAPIWKDLENRLSASRSSKSEINITRLSKITKDGDVIAVPGKILGSGNLSHALTVFSFSISETAIKKIMQAGGKVITINELINKYPNGTGVKIIG